MLFRSLAAIPIAALLGATSPYLQQTQQAQPAQQTTVSEVAAFNIPASIQAQANPEHPASEAMTMAKRMYGYDCAMCHGDNGDGKGNMASTLKTSMKDWRDPSSLKGLTDGDLFYMIKKGHGEMPPEEGRQNDAGLWNLVRVVRSFAKS